ncbi:VanZ family protein [Bacillus sp. EB600]|uniref:VanZ family protein n=1 Tax=Bacillus sp. EB600 TaxID=2806345 RepID=UPI00210C0C9E|nr:VanZ family protein [Bacillus sp. EB600]
MKTKLLLVIVWGMFLGMDTWTDNLGALLRFQTIGFKWVSSPDFLSFFYWTDISKIHHNFVIVKIGHFLGFGMFDFLLFNWKQSHKEALGISFTFALLTEVLQLFFGRDGRLYDLLIDSFGAMSVYFIVKFNYLNKTKEILFKKFMSH